MGYYHILLSKEATNLFTIIPIWVKYKYKHLPMGVCNSPDIFLEQMNELFRRMEFIREYIDDLLIISMGNCSDH